MSDLDTRIGTIAARFGELCGGIVAHHLDEQPLSDRYVYGTKSNTIAALIT